MKGRRSWKINDEVIPDDLRALMQETVRNRRIVGEDGVPLPPWQEFPNIPRSSIGWRMGPGEDYIIGFGDWFKVLGADQRAGYIRQYPEPEEWSGFYEAYSS